MSTLGNRIRDRRIELGMSVDELAERLGKNRATIYRYEGDEIENFPFPIIKPLAEALRTSPAYLMGWTDEKSGITPSAHSSIRIPILGSIPAGIPIEAIEDILDWEDIPASMARGGKEYFALKIEGDSMYPRYEDGDIIIFLRQETCESGQDCAVMVNGNDATFKRVKLAENGLTLQPLNPVYDPKFFSTKEVNHLPVRIIGVAVEVRRKI